VNGDRVYVQNKGIAHFSFEYSDRYRKSVDDTSGRVTSLFFKREYRDAGGFTFWWFLVAAPGIYAESAQVYLEQELALARQHSTDFKLLYVSGLQVAGVTGTQLVYTYTRPKAADWGSARPTGALVKDVYFESDGLIWRIESDAFIDTATADMADFDHVLTTFKILD
jgi:hypothetical protein